MVATNSKISHCYGHSPHSDFDVDDPSASATRRPEIPTCPASQVSPDSRDCATSPLPRSAWGLPCRSASNTGFVGLTKPGVPNQSRVHFGMTDSQFRKLLVRHSVNESTSRPRKLKISSTLGSQYLRRRTCLAVNIQDFWKGTLDLSFLLGRFGFFSAFLNPQQLRSG